MVNAVNAASCDLAERTQALLVQAGLRRTRATVSVVTLFLQDPAWSPTHADIDQALEGMGVQVNRVTLYRLLERLAQAGLLERHPDADARGWRFFLADPATGSATPRFECDACHRQFRVTAASRATRAATERLLRTLATLGHQGARVDLSIHGTCAGCAAPSGTPAGA
jgi:Fur family transcriptional regulator, ferric uptake regulator